MLGRSAKMGKQPTISKKTNQRDVEKHISLNFIQLCLIFL